jgi:small nuclear ribonucleoprotein (snRNP)-like protein
MLAKRTGEQYMGHILLTVAELLREQTRTNKGARPALPRSPEWKFHLGTSMVRSVTATICTVLLAAPASPQGAVPPVRDQVAQISPGKTVEVRLRDGKKLEGTLVSAAESSFTVQVDKNPMNVSYQDAQSVKRKGMSGLKKGLIIGGIVAVAGAVGGILAAISRG